MNIKSLLAALVVSLSLVAPVLAGPLDDADAAIARGDYKKAFLLIAPLADQGVAEAQFGLGAMYERGLGVLKDYKNAVAWYRLAAAQDHDLSQVNLGKLYYQGRGLPQDYGLAVVWYRKGAEQGYAHGQFMLAAMYAAGMGVPKNLVESYKWLELAAAQELKGAIQSREILARLMTPAQIAEVQRLAREWKPKK